MVASASQNKKVMYCVATMQLQGIKKFYVVCC